MYIRVSSCTFIHCFKTHFGSTKFSHFNFNKIGAYLFKCFKEDKSKMVKIAQRDYQNNEQPANTVKIMNKL